MKSYFYFVLICLLLFVGKQTQAQCPSGYVLLSTQAEVDAFAIDYPNCTEMAAMLDINGNNITDLSSLNNLTSVYFGIKIESTHITSLAGLENLEYVGSYFIIKNNSLLTSISQLSNLNSVNISISFNNSLTSLEGLNNLTSSSGINIADNPSLTSISALSGITFISNHLLIVRNNNLTSLNGLNNLTNLDGSLVIGGNNSLTSLSGLDNLQSVAHYLDILFNMQLTSIEALNNLEAIWGSLSIQGNNSLTTLSGLSNLSYVEQISITQNEVLTDITALQNVNPAYILPDEFNGLYIVDNPALSVCNLPNFCTYLQGPGARIIDGNAGNCLNEQVVLNSCNLNIDSNEISTFQIYPNPVKDIVYFDQKVSQITVTDFSGKVLIQENDIINIDLSGFQRGIYLITLENDNQKQTKKIIKE
jgi:hypothetical protein